METIKAELTALHQVLGRMEYIVLTSADTKRIARIMDQAEHLVDLMLRDEFDVGRFHTALQDIGRESNVLASIAGEYLMRRENADAVT